MTITYKCNKCGKEQNVRKGMVGPRAEGTHLCAECFKEFSDKQLILDNKLNAGYRALKDEYNYDGMC